MPPAPAAVTIAPTAAKWSAPAPPHQESAAREDTADNAVDDDEDNDFAVTWDLDAAATILDVLSDAASTVDAYQEYQP